MTVDRPDLDAIRDGLEKDRITAVIPPRRKDVRLIATLLDEVERLRSELDVTEEANERLRRLVLDVKDRDDARAERDHYRAWIEAMLDDHHLWRNQGEDRLRWNVRTTLRGALDGGAA